MPKRGQHYTLGIRHGAVTPYPPPPARGEGQSVCDNI